MGNEKCDPTVLPPDVLYQIMENLDFVSLLRAGATCMRWHEVADSNLLWKKLVINKLCLMYWIYSKCTVNYFGAANTALALHTSANLNLLLSIYFGLVK